MKIAKFILCMAFIIVMFYMAVRLPNIIRDIRGDNDTSWKAARVHESIRVSGYGISWY